MPNSDEITIGKWDVLVFGVFVFIVVPIVLVFAFFGG